MKPSSLLSFFLFSALPSLVEPIVCLLLKQRLNEGDTSGYTCRNRPDFKLLGGPGCRVSCLVDETLCGNVGDGDEEICGKLRLRIGVYAFARVIYELCIVPDGGPFARHFGRYCLSLRYCLLQQRPCGCGVVADGRRCHCRIETTNSSFTPVVDNCPVIDPDNPGNSSSVMMGLLPSEDEFSLDMSMVIEDDALASGLDEAYAAFLDYLNAVK